MPERTVSRARKEPSTLVTGVVLLVYALLGIGASFVFWVYSENVYLWYWIFRATGLAYGPYTRSLKLISGAVAVVATVVLVLAMLQVFHALIYREEE